MNDEVNVAIVRRFYALFEDGNMDEALSLVSNDVQWQFQGPEEIPCAGVFRGPQGVQDFLGSIADYVEIEEFNVLEYFADGDCVFVLGDERVRVKSTGKCFEMEWCDVYRLKDGKIVEFREFADTGAMLLAYRGES